MIAHHQQNPAAANVPTPNVSESDKCTKLIRKLRWIGLDEEARHLEMTLRTCAPHERGTVLAEPASTD
jgi:hypothetical protein